MHCCGPVPKASALAAQVIRLRRGVPLVGGRVVVEAGGTAGVRGPSIADALLGGGVL